MNSFNLFSLTRVRDKDAFDKFEKHLSNREKIKRNKEHEIYSLVELVSVLSEHGATYDVFDAFYFSFDIPQISKEFDLLRINADTVINIELKSEMTNDYDIKKQLVQNKYYLNHLSRAMYFFTFVAETKEFYKLTDEDELISCEVAEVLQTLKSQKNCRYADIHSLFRPVDFLVSPLNTPDRFLRGEYFLTSQQESFKKIILEGIASSDEKIFGITGDTGTGKTLLLYDIALTLSAIGRCLIIHCGILNKGHNSIDKNVENIDIIEAQEIDENIDFLRYKYILIDECHRFFSIQLDRVMQASKEYGIPIIFSYDYTQTFLNKEEKEDITAKIASLLDDRTLNLSGKIRTNKELTSFIARLFDLTSNKTWESYPSVSIAFSNNPEETKIILENYVKQGYKFINYIPLEYKNGNFDNDEYFSVHTTYEVIGQEFDNVVMLIDSTFIYNENHRLVSTRSEKPDNIYSQLLLHGLTRVREKLAIIVIENEVLFKCVLSILHTPRE